MARFSGFEIGNSCPPDLRQTKTAHRPLTVSSLRRLRIRKSTPAYFGGGFLMKKILVITLFMLATLAWAAAQQPGTTPNQSSGQATPPSSQTPGANASQAPEATPSVTEGCLGGSNPNYTITNSSGVTYKLNIPPNADSSKLAAHVGESVNVAGNVNDAGKAGSPSIDVQGIGRGTGNCPANGSKSPQASPKQ
jgi:hypothetical protein